MGTSSSKSPLERRNTVARRSQRRIIHSLKSRVDKINQEIYKFHGTENDEKYKKLTNEIYRIHKELTDRSRDLQPQVKNIHQITVTKLEEASRALESKILESRGEASNKQEPQEKQKQKGKKSKKKVVKKTEESDEDDIEITEEQEHEDNETYEEHEESQLASSKEKRHTVELKFIKVIPESKVEADVHSELTSPKIKSAEEKRKSILKMGVPVMPAVMMSEMAKKLSIIAPEDDPQLVNDSSDDHLHVIKDINAELEAIEYDIAYFHGGKNGTQYRRIKDTLNRFYNKVGRMSTTDDNTLQQISLCKNYIMSCSRFLDDKAIDDERVIENRKGVENETAEDNENKSHDNVFSIENNNVLSQHEVNMKLQKLTRTTAI